ncbi:MAG TPA: cytochrome C oxidase subunit IV family protein [Gemmatimonadales bacterium]|nr:cytochrome C oxidase subunit IV family protein [Gemmatimonadales bacterium]
MPDSHAVDQPHPVEHPHPTAGTYIRVAIILTVLTVIEVGVFYVPAFHPVLVPVLLTLSAIKFAIVVMFYMHLKMDSKFFTFLFGGPLLLAGAVMLGLMFLFGVLTLGR